VVPISHNFLSVLLFPLPPYLKMAPHIRPSSLLLFISSLLAVTEGHTRAKLVLQERATYNGGWALGIPGSTCPSIAPVACDTGDSTVNPNCCPSGQTCLGLIDPYCCPTGALPPPPPILPKPLKLAPSYELGDADFLRD